METKTLIFAGTATARTQTTLVSKRIDRPIRLDQITARFAPGCQNLLTLAFWLSPDDDAPTTGDPTGVNLLRDYSQSLTLRGDGEQIVLPHNQRVPETGYYLKVVATNDDWYDHAIEVDMQITIDPPPEVPYAP